MKSKRKTIFFFWHGGYSWRRCILRLILLRAEGSAFLLCRNTIRWSQQAPLDFSRVGCGLAGFQPSALVPGTAPAPGCFPMPTVWFTHLVWSPQERTSQRLQAWVGETLETAKPISTPSILCVGSSIHLGLINSSSCILHRWLRKGSQSQMWHTCGFTEWLLKPGLENDDEVSKVQAMVTASQVWI